MEWLFIIGLIIYSIISSAGSGSKEKKTASSPAKRESKPDTSESRAKIAALEKEHAEWLRQLEEPLEPSKPVEKSKISDGSKMQSTPAVSDVKASTDLSGVKKVNPTSAAVTSMAISSTTSSTAPSGTNKSGRRSTVSHYDNTRPAASTSVSRTGETALSHAARDDLLSAYESYEKSTTVSTNSRNDSAYLKAKSFLNEQGVHSFWHMTHWQNLQGILKQGVLNHDLARRGMKVVDISERTVQDRRMAREPKFNRSIHDYAPLYINPRNPMLYVRRELSQDLCLIEISMDVLRESFTGRLVFTDGNAASKATSFYRDLTDMHRLPWDVLTNEYWNEFLDGKRKRCAEVLVHQHISNKLITGIHVSNRSRAGRLRVGNDEWVIQYSPQLFFRN